MQSKNILSSIKKELSDYLFGIPSTKEYTQRELYIREFYPELVKSEKCCVPQNYSIALLRTALDNIRDERAIPKYIQPILTFAATLPVLGYFNNEFNVNELSIYLGALTLIKSIIYFSTKYRLKERKGIEEMFKEQSNDDKDLDGEEWKNGTDYGFSFDE